MTAARACLSIFAAACLFGCASSAERQAETEKRQRLADTYLQLGVNYLQRGQLEASKDNLEKALDLNPDSPQANNMMGLLQWRLNAYPEAEKYLRRSLELNDKDPETWNNYGVFQCERGQYDKAEKAFQRALADPLYRTPAEANVNAGRCLMRKPSPMAAEKYFRAALAINPKQPRALLEMAKLSFNAGRTVSSRAFIQRYFEVGADTPESLLVASRIEKALGNRDAEASYAVRLRGKFPDSDEATQLKPDPNTGKSGGRTQR